MKLYDALMVEWTADSSSNSVDIENNLDKITGSLEICWEVKHEYSG